MEIKTYELSDGYKVEGSFYKRLGKFELTQFGVHVADISILIGRPTAVAIMNIHEGEVRLSTSYDTEGRLVVRISVPEIWEEDLSKAGLLLYQSRCAAEKGRVIQEFFDKYLNVIAGNQRVILAQEGDII